MNKLIERRAAMFFAASPLAGMPDWETIETFDDPLFQEKKRHEHFRRRLKEGHICVGFRDAGEVISYIWVTVGKAVPCYLGMEHMVAADEAYYWDSRTAESHRQRGYYKRIMHSSLTFPGVRRMTFLVDRTNLIVQQNNAKLGYRPICDIEFWRIGPLRFAVQDRALPRLLLGPWRPRERT